LYARPPFAEPGVCGSKGTVVFLGMAGSMGCQLVDLAAEGAGAESCQVTWLWQEGCGHWGCRLLLWRAIEELGLKATVFWTELSGYSGTGVGAGGMAGVLVGDKTRGGSHSGQKAMASIASFI